MPAHVTPITGDAPKRINIAISPAAFADVDLVIEREGVSLTEAVHRLLAYGGLVYRTTRIDGGKIIAENADGELREIVVL